MTVKNCFWYVTSFGKRGIKVTSNMCKQRFNVSLCCFNASLMHLKTAMCLKCPDVLTHFNIPIIITFSCQNIISQIIITHPGTPRVCKFYWWVESLWLLLHKFWSHFGILKYHNEKAIFRLSSTWSWHVYTIVRDTQSSCVGPLTWKAKIHDGGHRVNFDCNLPSSCFVVQYNSLILMI